MALDSIENVAAGLEVFTSNAFLVGGERSVLVDSGANFDAVAAIRERGVEPDAVVLTHTHPDHVGNVPGVKRAFGVETWGFDPSRDPVDNRIEDGEVLTIGDARFRAIHTPGHIDDHLCLYSADASVLFVGDLIFQNGGFGRTDLAEGDRVELVHSIEQIVDTVDPDLETMHCGHGPSVTVDPYSHVEAALRKARW